MRKSVLYLFGSWLFGFFWMMPVYAVAQTERPSTLVIEGGTLIDGNGGTPVQDAVIVIQGNKIATVSRKGQAPVPDGTQVVRADGKFIFPGLMDAHLHYSGFLAELMLAHGVTSAFDIGGRGIYHVARREAIARGRVPGPRLFIVVETLLGPVKAGRIVYGTYGRQAEPVKVEKALQIVRSAIAAGADMINIWRRISKAVFEAPVEEAHKAGLPVVAQAIGPEVFAREAVLAGADVLEPASGINISMAKDPSKGKNWGLAEDDSLDPRPFADMDETKAAEMIRLLVDRKVHLEPDLIAEGRGLHRQQAQWKLQDYELLSNPALAYIPEGTRYKWLANYTHFDELEPADREMVRKGFQNMQRFIGQFARAGGKVLTGTDTSNGGWAVPGVGVQREMELLVEAGLTPMEAIQAATRNAAEGYRVLNRVGTIEPGKLADLVIVNDDPLKDIRNVQKIEWVIQDGKVVDRTYHRWFSDPFEGEFVEAPEWVDALKQVTAAGIRTIAGLTDPRWEFGQPCPGIESLSPNVVTEGGAATTVTINGVNFTKKSVVYWGERPVPSQLIGETELRATIDAGLMARAGVFPITVRNPGPYLSQPKWGSVSNRAFLLVNFKKQGT